MQEKVGYHLLNTTKPPIKLHSFWLAKSQTLWPSPAVLVILTRRNTNNFRGRALPLYPGRILPPICTLKRTYFVYTVQSCLPPLHGTKREKPAATRALPASQPQYRSCDHASFFGISPFRLFLTGHRLHCERIHGAIM